MSLRLALLAVILPSVSLFAQAPEALITEPAAVLDGLPREVFKDLRAGADKMMEAAGKASMQAAKTEGQQASFKITVASIDPFQAAEAPTVTRYKILGRVEPVRVSGASINVHILAVLAVEEHAKVPKVKRGDKLTITGRIGNAEVLGRSNAELHLDIKEVKLK